jgi:hypothetical protein
LWAVLAEALDNQNDRVSLPDNPINGLYAMPYRTHA